MHIYRICSCLSAYIYIYIYSRIWHENILNLTDKKDEKAPANTKHSRIQYLLLDIGTLLLSWQSSQQS
jgi:hypothetical protein